MTQHDQRPTLTSTQNLAPSLSEQPPTPKRRRAATPAQIRANRSNAKKSTGPRTAAGKAICSQNALRHGFTGGFRMMGPEDRREFDQLVAQLHADLKPTTVLEAMLLERMAQHHWVVQRSIRYQNNCVEESFFIAENFNVLLRYHTTHERAFSRALADHLKLRNQRLKEEKSNSRSQTAPTPPADAESEPALAPADPLTATATTHAAAPETETAPPTVTAQSPHCAAKTMTPNHLHEFGSVSQNSHASPTSSLAAANHPKSALKGKFNTPV